MASSTVRKGMWALGFGALVILLIFGALPSIASTQIVRDRIAMEMSAWSGYRVTLGSAPEIDVWPSFRAILHDVTLSDWDDTTIKPVVEAERVEIDLSPIAALRGDVVFSTARLIRPLLRIEPSGRLVSAPDFPSGGRIARSVEAARRIVEANPNNPDVRELPDDPFGTIAFSDGRIAIERGKDDVEIVSGMSGTLAWPALDRAATVAATGIWRGESVTVDVSAQNPLLLFAGAAAPLTLNFKSAPATVAFDGLANMSGDTYFDGQVMLSSPSLRRILEWSQAEIVPGATIGSISLTGKATGNSQRVKFQNAELTLDGNAGIGALEAAFSDAIPAISGTLAFEKLDLRSFLSAFTPLSQTTNIGDIDTSFAEQVNLDLRLSAAKATVGPVTLIDVAATAQVKSGLAAFDISDATAFGGTVQTSLRLDRTGQNELVEMRLLATDVESGILAASVNAKRLVPTGRGTLSVILKGRGHNWNAILENAEGTVSASFGPGALAGFDLPGFLKRAGTGGFFSLDEVGGGTLPILVAELKATVSNGVARIEKAEARSADYSILLNGIIPYVGGGLALTGSISDVSADAAQTSKTEATFFVGGSWSAPFISPFFSGTALGRPAED